MASLPAQFTDHSLQQQLQSARSLKDGQACRTPPLHSGIEALDELFRHTRPGDLIEWGIPPGMNGRLIPLQLLKQQIPPSVWIYHHHGLGVFASSWISHGVDLQRLFFICSENPVRELRPLFLEDTFKRIIIDAPRKFSSGDMAFVSQQARKQGQIVFLIRHFFLSAKRGNPYASLRINTWQSGKAAFSLQLVKGATNGRISLPYAAVAEDHGQYN
jgi:replicative DNA helicase